MKYGWIKINGYSYIGKISNEDTDNQLCDVQIGNTLFVEVPFSEVQAINGCKLPWE